MSETLHSNHEKETLHQQVVEGKIKEKKRKEASDTPQTFSINSPKSN